jgi:predicted SnoaL-like aldol condensation-catalyzing enzyme
MTISTMRRLAVAAIALTVYSVAPMAQSTPMTAKEQANLKFVLDWWREVLESRHLDLTPKYQAENYIQHNINVPTGREGFVSFFSRLGPPINPIRDKLANPPVVQFAKGDFVVLVWEREGKDPADASKTYKYNTYDMLRLENGKVQEHWDYAVKTKGTPAGGAPDGIDYSAVKFSQSPQEQKNLEIATVEFKDILQYGHTELAEKVMAPTYIQHNPNVPTGRAAFVEFFSRIRKPEPLKAEWKNKPTLMFASGAYVFVVVKRAEKDPDDPTKTYPAYWFDMVRVDNGMIQEHWDAAMKNPPPPPAAGRGAH